MAGNGLKIAAAKAGIRLLFETILKPSPRSVFEGLEEDSTPHIDQPPPASPLPRTATAVLEPPPQEGVTTEETVAYQNKEIGKEMLMLERHLTQGCKINAKPCDCCKKHVMTIEALAQEGLGITGDDKYQKAVDFVQAIAPIVTPQASGSGKYDEEYPKLASKARLIRKDIVGTEEASALI